MKQGAFVYPVSIQIEMDALVGTHGHGLGSDRSVFIDGTREKISLQSLAT